MTISGFTAYVKQLWKNKPDTSTPLSADRLLHIEDGIKGNSDAIAKIAAAVVNQITNDPDKIASMAALYAVNQSVTKLNSDFANKFSHTEASIYLKKDDRIGASQVLKNSDASNDYGTSIIDFSNVYNTTLVIHNGAAKLLRTDTSGNSEAYDICTSANINMLSADGIQCDYANDTAYYKVLKNGIIHQLSFNRSGMQYHIFDGINWTLIWDK